MNVYKVKVPYGRGEMTSEYLVAAYSPVRAKNIANKATPCSAPPHSIECTLIQKLHYNATEPTVICKL